MRPADWRFCETCKRGTGHTKQGACMACRSRVRKATRRAKASSQGSNLARFGDLLFIADALWSIWTRAKVTGCEMCGAPLHPDVLQCAHGFSRVERILRFRPDNTFGLCSSCHRRHTPPRQAWWDWMREHLGGEAYEHLEYLSRVGGRIRLSDLHLVILEAQQRIEALPAGPRREWAEEKAGRVLERMVRMGVRAA